jgi:CBS domain-containing protein
MASPNLKPAQTVLLSTLLRQPVLDSKNNQIGALADLIVSLRGEQYPLLTGLVIGLGSSRVFAPLTDITAIAADRVQLRTARLDLRPFERREGEVLLSADVLGHRLIDVEHAALVKAYDVTLTATGDGWVATGLDVHKNRWFQFGARHETHPARDWHTFEPLIGHEGSVKTRSASGRIRGLKPAQIADIIENASTREQNELLAEVHTDPELEADVFEELQDNDQAQLLRNRSNEDVAGVLSRMRADDAADAIMDLPQDRRQDVLNLLPETEHAKVMALLGYHDATAGGMMGTDYLALSEDKSIADALEVLRNATTQQPEALTTIHTLSPDGTLAGTLNLVRALQLDPATNLRDAADQDPIAVSPGDDIIEVTTRMADYNLLTLPVLDDTGRILGVITVDDALEAAIPEDWSRREPGHHATPAGGTAPEL